ncbi:MAG: DsbA family protein [Micromonosporaceae bacterium]
MGAGARPGGARFSTRTRILAGSATAVAALAVLAVAAMPAPGHPARVRAAPRTTGSAGAAGAAPPGARPPSAGAADPNPSAHPDAGPSAPPTGAGLTLGRADAPVTMVEFGDYQCTNCGEFARVTEPALVRKYVDTGVVRLVWRDFPWVDAQSLTAAAAARAAGMQGKFWQYHDYLFAHQSADEHSGLLTRAYLRSVARRLSLNMTAFDRDAVSPALTAAVRADDMFGQQLGVPGTPAFLINGRPLFGAQPLSAFAAAISQARQGQ